MDCALFVDCCICRHSSVGIGIKELGGQTPSPSPSCPLPSPPFLPPFPFGPPKQGLKYLKKSTTHREGRWRAVAQLREAMGAVASGRPWKGGAACRQQCFFFKFCLITKFCHVLWLPMTLHSIHFAQYAHALPLTIIS